MLNIKMEPNKTNKCVSKLYKEKCCFCGAHPEIESMNAQELRYCSICSNNFFVIPTDSDKHCHGSAELINDNVNDLQSRIKQEMDPLSDEFADQPLVPCTTIHKNDPDSDQGCSYSYFNSSSFEENDMFEATDTKFSISDPISWNIDSDKSQQNEYNNAQSTIDVDEKPIVKWKLFENNSDKGKNWNLQVGSLNDFSSTKIQIQSHTSKKKDIVLQNNPKSMGKNKVSVEMNKIYNNSAQHDDILASHVKSLRKITRKLKFYCDLCKTGFSYKSTLITHLRKLHFDHVKQCFSCDLCGKKYKKKGHIARHMLTAHIKSMHECLACGEKFREKRGLTIHIERFHSAIYTSTSVKNANKTLKVYQTITTTC